MSKASILSFRGYINVFLHWGTLSSLFLASNPPESTDKAKIEFYVFEIDRCGWYKSILALHRVFLCISMVFYGFLLDFWVLPMFLDSLTILLYSLALRWRIFFLSIFRLDSSTLRGCIFSKFIGFVNVCTIFVNTWWMYHIHIVYIFRYINSLRVILFFFTNPSGLFLTRRIHPRNRPIVDVLYSLHCIVYTIL